MKKFKNFWFYTGTFCLYMLLVVIFSAIAGAFLSKPVYSFLIKNFAMLNVGSSYDTILIVNDDNTKEKYGFLGYDGYADLIDFFNSYTKAKVIGFDASIQEFDPNNKSNVRLLENIKKDNLVMGFHPGNDPDDDVEVFETFRNKQKLDVKITSKDDYPIIFNGLTNSSVYLRTQDINYGSVYFKEDATTNQIYDCEYIVRIGEDFYPSLALKMYLLAVGTNEVVLDKDKLIIPATGLKIPLNYKPKGANDTKNEYASLLKTPIWYYRMANYNSYSHDNAASAYKILDTYYALKKGITPESNPEMYAPENNDRLIDPKLFEDKFIFIGSNITGPTADVKKTPMHQRHPGLDIQATTFDNLVYGDFLQRNGIAILLIDLLSFIILSLIVFIIILKTRVFKGLLAIIGINFVYIVLLIGLTICGIITNPVFPISAEVVTLIFGYSFKFITENRNKEKIKQAMGKYLSQDIMKNVVSNIDDLKLGGKRANVTVLFSDIRGFTSMSEKMSAEDVTKILNEYFTEMEPIITKYNGVINKFIGDAVMAIFGEPIQDINHPHNAVRCAYEMLLKVEYLREKWIREGKPKIEIGIGICTGEVFIGNIGSEARMEYTVIGDTVNLASRIESFNKVYKTNLLVSSSTYAQISEVADVIKINEVKIRGKAQKMNIYEVLRIEKPKN